MPDMSGWFQAGVAGLVAACGTVFWAGSANRELADTHAQVRAVQQAQQTDHDKVTKLDQRLDDIQSDVHDIKSDVKKLVSKVH